MPKVTANYLLRVPVVAALLQRDVGQRAILAVSGIRKLLNLTLSTEPPFIRNPDRNEYLLRGGVSE